jgi:hypothetical protein
MSRCSLGVNISWNVIVHTLPLEMHMDGAIQLQRHIYVSNYNWAQIVKHT